VTPPFRHLAGAGLTTDEAFDLAARLVEEMGEEMGEELGAGVGGRRLDVVGEYVVPPAHGSPTRPFQTLHVDFGLPLVPVRPADVATCTALHVPPTAPTEGAVTRLVPLDGLLAQRPWPGREELLRRIEAYGGSHGAWDDAEGYVEGSLARLVEAADGVALLPSVKAEPQFLCGLEFDSAAAEARHLAALGLDVEAVAVGVRLAPGDLLLFDNHAVAHGRLGRRLPGELHQRFFGVRAAPVVELLRMRDRLLERFAGTGSVSPRVEGSRRTA
jgi:Taurine catabolism dioxygenase TauD, TfdA family